MRLIRISLDYLIHNWKRTLLGILILMFPLLLVVILFAMDEGIMHGYRTADKIITTGYDSVISLHIESFGQNGKDYFTPQYGEFFHEIEEIEEVQACGSILKNNIGSITGEQNEIKGLQELQSNLNSNKGLSVIRINKSILNMIDVNVANGMSADALDFRDIRGKPVQYVYLGSNYHNLPQKTTYEDTHSVYQIAGILESSQKFLNGELVRGVDPFIFDYTIDTSDSILIIQDQFPYSTDVFVSLVDGASLNLALHKIYSLSDRYSAQINHYILTDAFNSTYGELLSLRIIIIRLIVITILTSILMLISMQWMDIMCDIHSLGILYAEGFSISEIRVIMFCKTCFIATISLVFVIPISILIILNWYLDFVIRDVIISIILYKVLPISSIILLGIVLIVHICAMKYLGSYSPRQMIGGSYD